MITILTVQEYMEKNQVPITDDKEKQITQLANYIEDATNQIDNLCGGKVFKEYPTLDPLNNPDDEARIYKLKRSIMDLTLLLDQTSKLFINSSQQGGGSAPFSISTRSENSQVEFKRQDIIKSLIAGKWYSNLRTGNDGVDNEYIDEDVEFNKLVARLSKEFLRIDGDNTYNSNRMIFPNTNSMSNVGDIIGGSVVDSNTGIPRDPILSGYRVLDTQQSEQTNKILDPLDNIYKLINEFDVNYFGGLTREEIYYAIQASGMIWNPEFNYRKGFVVQFTTPANFLRFAESKIDNNIGFNPNTSPNAWKVLESQPIDETAIIEQLKPFIGVEITRQIDELPTVDVYSKDEVDDLIEDFPKLSGINTFKGENTFEFRTTFKQPTTMERNLLINNPNPTSIIFLADNGSVKGLLDPTLPQDAVNKRYVDNAVNGIKSRVVITSTNGDIYIGKDRIILDCQIVERTSNLYTRIIIQQQASGTNAYRLQQGQLNDWNNWSNVGSVRVRYYYIDAITSKTLELEKGEENE